MKVSIRLFCMAAIALSLTFLGTTAGAKAQPFPQCANGPLTITNTSPLPADVCVKGLNCFNVPANSTIFVPILPGTQIPGIAGVANVTYAWQANPFPPPTYWVPSIALNPTGRCFNVYFDDLNCTIIVRLVSGPPCINP